MLILYLFKSYLDSLSFINFFEKYIAMNWMYRIAYTGHLNKNTWIHNQIESTFSFQSIFFNKISPQDYLYSQIVYVHKSCIKSTRIKKRYSL